MGSSALISGDGLKLVEAKRKQGVFQLYDILSDNEERHDIATDSPEKVANLKAILTREIDSRRADIDADDL